MATVTSFQFWVGDGVTTAFTIMDPSGEAAVNPVVSTLYRTDWQGKQLMYTTARTNMHVRSQEFNDAAWSPLRASVSPNAITAPDGTLTADKLIEDNTAANTHFILSFNNVVVTNGVTYTSSVYAKAGARSWVQLQEGQGTTAAAYFNLATGAIGTVSGTGSPAATITSIGDGWYRLTLRFTAIGAAARIRLFMATGNGGGVYSGDGTSYLYLWGAQMEAGSTATSYIPTVAAAVAVTDYSVAVSTATFAQAPLDRALLEWTGIDDNAAFIPRAGGFAVPYGGFGTLGAS